jgi:hypothetical protein
MDKNLIFLPFCPIPKACLPAGMGETKKIYLFPLGIQGKNR